jgi:NDP-sugar pyrophosphorylase family protein
VQAVILAGGLGTRLAPYTTVLPKPLMPVGQWPILEVVLRQLRRSGFDRVELATGHLSALLQAYFGDGSRWGLSIRYHVERERAGTAGPLALMGDVLDDVFLVMNGDVLTDIDFNDLYKTHVTSGAVLTAATCQKSITLPLGAIVRNSEGTVSGYLEKPTYQFECSAGIYVANLCVIERIEKGRIFDLPELVVRLVQAKAKVETYPITGFWLDIGTPEDYRQANDQFLRYFSDLMLDADALQQT